MAELRRSKRLAADIRYVDPSAPQVETDEAKLSELRQSSLTQDKTSKAKQVFEYINRADIETIEREKYAEWQAQQAEEAEAKEAQQVKPPKFFDLLLRDAANRSALKTLIIVTTLMCTLPVGAFYIGHNFLFTGYAENWNLSFSGFLAVVMVNVVSLGFGAYAYYEPEEPESETERLARLQGDRDRTDAWVREITRGRMVAQGKFAEDEDAEEDTADEKTTQVDDSKSINLDRPAGKSSKSKKR